jgi:hypothetical protein
MNTVAVLVNILIQDIALTGSVYGLQFKHI